MATDTQLNELFINKFGSQAAYEAAVATGQVPPMSLSVWPDEGGGGGGGNCICICVRPNLLDNGYFAGAEIWARAGSPYYASDIVGYLDADTKIAEYSGVLDIYHIIVNGTQYNMPSMFCYQKSGSGPVNQKRQAAPFLAY